METLVIKYAEHASEELIREVFETTFNCSVLYVQCVDKKDAQGKPFKMVYIEVDYSKSMAHFIEQIKSYGYDYVNYNKNLSWKVTLPEPKKSKVSTQFIPRIIY
jgi:hypothetical protein